MSALGRVSVIVPARDEGPHVREHLARIAAAMDRLGRPFEVLLVDDGSGDATRAEAEAAAAADPRIRVLAHPHNLGKGAALSTGCAAATGDVLVFLDADLEISPDQVGPILGLVDGGADLAVASKYHPGSTQRRPWHRVALSRVYQAVTSVLFRLPIRDTQTGLKAIRSSLAQAVVPAIRTRRYAWDIECLVLAHRLGARIRAGPVSVDFLDRGVRIPLRGFLASGVDTARTFVRDRWLAGYAGALRAARPRRAPPRTRAVLSLDDLGLAPGVDRAAAAALAAREATSASLLAQGPTAASAVRSLPAGADVGVHLDLAGGSVARFVLRSLLGLEPAAAVTARVRAQVDRARALGANPTHVDAHRHAFFLPATYRAVLREARRHGIAAARLPRPLGALRCGPGVAGLGKGALLASVAPWLRAAARRLGVATPDGVADAAVVEGWVRAGRWPRALVGRTLEVIAHPGDGDDVGLPPSDRGLDRAGDARRLRALRAGIEALGVAVVDFRSLECLPPPGAAAAPRRMA